MHISSAEYEVSDNGLLYFTINGTKVIDGIDKEDAGYILKLLKKGVRLQKEREEKNGS